MTRVWVNLVVLAMLAGCGDSAGGSKDNPFEPDPATSTSTDASSDSTTTDTTTGTDGVEEAEEVVTEDNAAGIPDALGVNVSGFTLADDLSEVKIISLGIDGGGDAANPLEVTYSRRAAMDILQDDGTTVAYYAFTQQEDSLDRLFVALGNFSQDRTTAGFVVGDGGQFNTVEKGGYYQRSGTYSDPASDGTAGSGQVSYAGYYAGITNRGAYDGNNLLPDDAGIPTSAQPAETFRTVGKVFLNANFVDRQVAGSIYDRVMISPTLDDGTLADATDGGRRSLESLAMVITTIDDQGEYFGNLEVDTIVNQGVGNYGGIFGGEGATSTSGLVSAERHISFNGDITEHGVFVLEKCGVTGDATLCGSSAGN